MTRPLSLSTSLLLRALLTAFFSGVVFSSWFFYFLTLIFLGGVIVIILFLCSVCSNKKILYLNKTKPFFITRLIRSVVLIDLAYFVCLASKNSFSNPINIRLYQAGSSGLVILLVLGLILCIISVIAITNVDKGPLTRSIYLSSLNKNRRVWIFRYIRVFDK